MKIVRVVLRVGTSQFYLDRTYDAEKNEFDNANTALSYLTELFKKQEALSVMLMTGGAQVAEPGLKELKHDPFMGAMPAVLNLTVIQMVVIESAGIYEIVEPSQQVEPTVEALPSEGGSMLKVSN